MKSLSYTLIILLLVIYSYRIESKKHKNKTCGDHIRDFGAFEANFTQCAIVHASPVTMCEKCGDRYEGILHFYNLVYENEICKDEYFDNDRLNIIEHMYLNVKGLWDIAYCSKCQNQTTHIMETIEDVNNCINMNIGTACSKCKDKYVGANKEYENLENKFSREICFDIQDKMNRTRKMWSKTLKCCKRTPNLTKFSAVSSTIMILPVLFYIGLIIYTKRRENNHEMLVADLENHNQRNSTHAIERNRVINQTDTNGVNEPIASTSTFQNEPLITIEENPKKTKVISDDDDDDDYDDDEDLLSLGGASNTQNSLIQLTPPSISEEIRKKIK